MISDIKHLIPGLSHDNNTNNSTNDGMDIEWKNLDLWMACITATFLFSIAIYLSEEEEKQHDILFDNSVLGRNKTEIVTRCRFLKLFGIYSSLIL